MRSARRPPAGRITPGRWLLAALASLTLLVLLWQFTLFLGVLYYAVAPVRMSSVMADELDRLRDTDPRARLEAQWVPRQRISVHLKRAVIAAEDGRFTEHRGVDWEAIERAMVHNQRLAERRARAEASGRPPPRQTVRGGSTISQQLAKNLFLSHDRSYLRKLQELVLTGMIEAVMSKERILELYLNTAEWGVGVFGAEAAARHHFGVSAAQLTPAQAARLAAMLPRPRFYDRNPASGLLARQTQVVLARMGDVRLP